MKEDVGMDYDSFLVVHHDAYTCWHTAHSYTLFLLLFGMAISAFYEHCKNRIVLM